MFDVLDMSIGVDFIDVKETLEARFDVDDDYNYAYADMECMRIDKLVCGYAMRIALEWLSHLWIYLLFFSLWNVGTLIGLTDD